jgi:hypothetical protein
MSNAEGDYRKRGLVRSGFRAISGGVGLVSESIKSRKDGKSPATGGSSEAQSKSGATSLQETKSVETGPPSYTESPQEGNLYIRCQK